MITRIDNSENIPDEILCRSASMGSREAEQMLVVRYNRMVRACARPYFLAGGDSEDLIQEGMLGLINAIREYDGEKNTLFKTYAEVCVKNRLYSAIRASKREKHTPLNNYISIDPPISDSSADYSEHYVDSCNLNDPEELVINEEGLSELLDAISVKLSKFESRILGLYLKGLSYQEISAEAGRAPKSVDNAVQRIRRKLAHYSIHGVNS